MSDLLGDGGLEPRFVCWGFHEEQRMCSVCPQYTARVGQRWSQVATGEGVRERGGSPVPAVPRWPERKTNRIHLQCARLRRLSRNWQGDPLRPSFGKPIYQRNDGKQATEDGAKGCEIVGNPPAAWKR